jgi:hypothetical protein
MQRFLAAVAALMVALGASLATQWAMATPSGEAPNSATSAVYAPLIVSCPILPPECGPRPGKTVTPPTTVAPAEPSATATSTSTPDTARVTTLPAGIDGFSDAGTHQLVRTGADRIYIVAPQIYTTHIRALRATKAGTPAAFTLVDEAHQPQATSNIWSVDAAIDAGDTIHVAYITEDGRVVYQVLDTTTDLWGTPQTVVDGGWPNRNNGLRQGSAGVAIAIDAAGVAHVVYSKTQNNLRRVYHNTNAGGNWNHEELVDEQPAADNSHATLAFGGDGALYVAWLSDANGAGSIYARVLRNGQWAASAVVDSGVYRDGEYSIDQGPSLLVTGDGRGHIAYIGSWEPVAGSPSGFEYGRLHQRYSPDGGVTWVSDDPPLRYTHNPTLTADAQGNLFVFGHREYWKASNCAAMLVNVQPAGSGWSSWRTLADGCFDSSVSARWAQYHRYAPDVIDLVYWTEKGPQGQSNVNQLQYAELRGGPDALALLPSAAP